jgi:hypothetical protein
MGLSSLIVAVPDPVDVGRIELGLADGGDRRDERGAGVWERGVALVGVVESGRTVNLS